MEHIEFNPSDIKGMRNLMKTYGNSNTMLPGHNSLGETVTISIFEDKIVVITYQHNKWIRKNIYHYDGATEELFEGKCN